MDVRSFVSANMRKWILMRGISVANDGEDAGGRRAQPGCFKVGGQGCEHMVGVTGPPGAFQGLCGQ